MSIKIAILLILYIRGSMRVLDDLQFLIDDTPSKHFMSPAFTVACMIAAAIAFVHVVYLVPIMLILFIELQAALKTERQRAAHKAMLRSQKKSAQGNADAA